MAASVSTQSAAVTGVATSTSVVSLLAAGARRSMFMIVNDSAGVLYLKFGAAASATDWTAKLIAGAAYESAAPAYGGLITGILDTGTGTARVTAY